jgi:hypothetical protein
MLIFFTRIDCDHNKVIPASKFDMKDLGKTSVILRVKIIKKDDCLYPKKIMMTTSQKVWSFNTNFMSTYTPLNLSLYKYIQT